MNLLLDTHTVLWCVNQHQKLSPIVKAVLLDDSHTLYVSVVSLWEISIKVSIGKMTELKGGVKTLLTKLENMPISILPITKQSIEIAENLPFIHRDPFDRMLVATAKSENMTILTADENIHKYDISFLW